MSKGRNDWTWRKVCDGITKKREEVQNNKMGNGNTESDKREGFGGGAVEQETRMAIGRYRTMSQDASKSILYIHI